MVPNETLNSADTKLELAVMYYRSYAQRWYQRETDLEFPKGGAAATTPNLAEIRSPLSRGGSCLCSLKPDLERKDIEIGFRTSFLVLS